MSEGTPAFEGHSGYNKFLAAEIEKEQSDKVVKGCSLVELGDMREDINYAHSLMSHIDSD